MNQEAKRGKTPEEKLISILLEVDAEARKEVVAGQECLPRYWDGKKDGIRIAMIVLGDAEDKDIQNVKSWQTSSRKSRYTPGEETEIFS